MPVVPSELGVGALERGVTVSLGLLDTVRRRSVSDFVPHIRSNSVRLLQYFDFVQRIR